MQQIGDAAELSSMPLPAQYGFHMHQQLATHYNKTYEQVLPSKTRSLAQEGGHCSFLDYCCPQPSAVFFVTEKHSHSSRLSTMGVLKGCPQKPVVQM